MIVDVIKEKIYYHGLQCESIEDAKQKIKDIWGLSDYGLTFCEFLIRQ